MVMVVVVVVGLDSPGPPCARPPDAGPPSAEPPKISLFFFPLPPPFRSFSVSLGVFSLNFGGVFEAPGPQMCTFGLLSCRVKPRRLCVFMYTHVVYVYVDVFHYVDVLV